MTPVDQAVEHSAAASPALQLARTAPSDAITHLSGGPIASEGPDMLFTSREYLLFLLAVFTLYWALPWHRVRVWLLLAASFWFYASWNSWLALLVCASASLDF